MTPADAVRALSDRIRELEATTEVGTVALTRKEARNVVAALACLDGACGTCRACLQGKLAEVLECDSMLCLYEKRMQAAEAEVARLRVALQQMMQMTEEVIEIDEDGRMSLADPSPIVASSRLSSPLVKVYNSPEFRLEWDNDVEHRIATNILHLRRFRGWSQVRVAKAMGTSQPKIARIEGGDDNITLSTLKRLVQALGGRFRVTIEPKEVMLPRLPEWWDVVRPLPAPQEAPESA